MNIPHLYVYLTSETVIALAIIALLLFLRNKKLSRLISKLKDIINDLELKNSANSFDLSMDYSSQLDQEIQRNKEKIGSLETIPLDEEDEETTEQNESYKELLSIRGDFLTTEKKATDLNENENAFWGSLYKSLGEIKNKYFTTTEEIINQENIHVEKVINKTTETVLEIEPQGKKIDAEVNKLKDIIFDQENSLNALAKALKNTSNTDNDTDTTELFEQLQQQTASLERTIQESKVCMEILESENDRLQEELTGFESRYNEMCEQLESGEFTSTSSIETESNENLNQLKSTLEEQDKQISELSHTVDDLQLEAEQAEKLKATLQEFTKGSQEMMTCITILEEENERLLEEVEEVKNAKNSSKDENVKLKQKIASLEEDAIKKDVAYAKLQDEYLSMEKEFLTLYEEKQNDN